MDEIRFAPTGDFLRERIRSFPLKPTVYAYGTVSSVSGDVVHLRGLKGISYGELVEIGEGVFALAMDLGIEESGVVLLDRGDRVEPGSLARGTGAVAAVPVGEALLGRVLDPLGRPLDGKPLKPQGYRPCEAPAPAIMDREPVNTPLETGILSVDSMIPIGRGQRELIVGDRQTGKTALALTAMIRQAEFHTGVICIYCAVGQKNARVASVCETLRQRGAMENTVVFTAGAGDPAALQYLAPFAATAAAEYFAGQGKDVLVVYDDLSRHAVAYRTLSLLLRRPAGREAYPGDIFYLHSRLLERSAKYGKELGGGSITALPIVETQAGDISAYVPTNVISITDGQIFLEQELFHQGLRPAVNVGLSVSRVGRSAQSHAVKRLSGGLRLRIAQYRDMAAFSQFGTELDQATAAILDHGAAVMELLKQEEGECLARSGEALILCALGTSRWDGMTPGDIAKSRKELLSQATQRIPAVLSRIDETGELSEEDEALLTDFAREVIGPWKAQ